MVLDEYFSGKLGLVMTPFSRLVMFPPHSANEALYNVVIMLDKKTLTIAKG